MNKDNNIVISKGSLCKLKWRPWWSLGESLVNNIDVFFFGIYKIVYSHINTSYKGLGLILA